MDDAQASQCLAELDRYRPLIRRLAPSIYEPEDIFQDVFIAATNGPDSCDRAHPEASWLRIVARNMAVRRYRQEAVRPCEQLLTADPVSDDAQDAPAAAERFERHAIVREAVKSLKPEHRHVIEQRFFAEESFSGIAGCLGIPEETVRSRYKRAMKKLRENPQLAVFA